VASVSGRSTGTTDLLHFPPTRARYIAVHIEQATDMEPPLLDELTVTAPPGGRSRS
jgi:hypothetical protein